MDIVNKKAFYNYSIGERLEAGVKLNGPEVKSVKGGRMNLTGSYVKIIGSEAYLVNASIPLYPYARVENYNPSRSRKLLLHKKELLSIKSKMEQVGLTIVPLKCYTKHGFLKLELGFGKGKKKWEKRDQLRKKAIEKDIQTAVRGKG